MQILKVSRKSRHLHTRPVVFVLQKESCQIDL